MALTILSDLSGVDGRSMHLLEQSSKSISLKSRLMTIPKFRLTQFIRRHLSNLWVRLLHLLHTFLLRLRLPRTTDHFRRRAMRQEELVIMLFWNIETFAYTNMNLGRILCEILIAIFRFETSPFCNDSYGFDSSTERSDPGTFGFPFFSCSRTSCGNDEYSSAARAILQTW